MTRAVTARLLAAAAATVASGALVMSVTPSAALPLSAPTAPRLIPAGYFGLNTPGVSSGPSLTAATTPVMPASAFGTVRYWDEPRTVSSIWCDVQPSPTTNLRASLAARLGPKLDAARSARAERVVIVLGHAAPWVYGARRGAGSTAVPAPWFCGGERSSVALPSAASLSLTGPARKTWTAYVHGVVDYLEAKYPGGLPFEVAFQTFNEPNWLASTRTGLPRTAVTAQEAATSLSNMDAVVRWVINHHSGTVGEQLSLYTSPLTRATGTFATSYLRLAESAQVRTARYDGFSMQTYSTVSAGETVDVSTLLARYNRGAIAAITAALGTYPRLGELPRHQTETNHGLNLGAAGATALSPTSQAVLATRLAIDGLRWGLTSQSYYTVNPHITAVKLTLSAQGGLTGTPAVVATVKRVRGWVVGQLLRGCSVVEQVVTCTLVDPATGKRSYLVYSDYGAPRSIQVPAGITHQTTIWGGSSRVTPGGAVSFFAAPVLLT